MFFPWNIIYSYKQGSAGSSIYSIYIIDIYIQIYMWSYVTVWPNLRFPPKKASWTSGFPYGLSVGEWFRDLIPDKNWSVHFNNFCLLQGGPPKSSTCQGGSISDVSIFFQCIQLEHLIPTHTPFDLIPEKTRAIKNTHLPTPSTSSTGPIRFFFKYSSWWFRPL